MVTKSRKPSGKKIAERASKGTAAKTPRKAVKNGKGAPKKAPVTAQKPAVKDEKMRGRPRLTPPLFSKVGGTGPAAGVSFQASVGAIFGARLLAERTLDPLFELGAAKPTSIRIESEAPLDDIAVETSEHGWLLIQAKNTLTFGSGLKSEFGKTVEQMVTEWRSSSVGSGARGWDRPLDAGRDRFVVAVGAGTSGTITTDLAKAVASTRASHSAPLPGQQREALQKAEDSAQRRVEENSRE
jgi:hypothetical protein